jgi:hypothetical protein
MLDRKTTVLTKHPVQRHEEFVYFQYMGDNDDYRVGYYLPRTDYDWMDQPEVITVMVRPEDRTTNGLQDEGVRVKPNLVSAEDLEGLPAGTIITGPAFNDELYKFDGAVWWTTGSESSWNSHQLEPRGPFKLLRIGDGD